MLRIKDIMTTKVVSASPGTTLREALELLSEHQISGAPVLENGRIVGIFSATDLLAVVADLDDAQPSVTFRGSQTPLEEMTVAEIMTRDVSSLPEDTAVTLAGAFMTRKQIHRVVVTSGERVVGIVTNTDFAKAFTEHCVSSTAKPPLLTAETCRCVPA